MGLVVSLFTLPLVFALLIAVSPHRLRKLLVIVAVALVSSSSLALAYILDAPISFNLPSYFSYIFAVADFVLLGYFARQGIVEKEPKVTGLALIQIVGLSALLLLAPHSGGFSMIADRLSAMMIALVSVVGGMICVYALDYMDDEETTQRRKSIFSALLVGFLGVMNFLVCANNMEWFYLAFELTTLASYLLIGFRNDDISRQNALKALWMNQVGGAAIVVAMIFGVFVYDSLYLDVWLAKSTAVYGLLPLAFLLAGSLVKGAQVPFQGWLLGAMVAPTPVSAILHSSTMVKIAPFVALKLSHALAGSAVAFFAGTLGGVVFVVCAVLALSQQNFKRILAYSTISLLGLMVLCAMLATPLSTLAALLLVLFHGVSKALLFMQAGVLEKRYHIKEIEQASGLLGYAPVTTMFILIGLTSIALPPFGVFLGKWLAFEGGAAASVKLVSVLYISLMAVGGVVLTLLYFKVAGRLVSTDNENINIPKNELQNGLYAVSAAVLTAGLIAGALGVAPFCASYLSKIAEMLCLAPCPVTNDGLSLISIAGSLKFWHILAALTLLIGSLLLASKLTLTGIDRAKPYSCGERTPANLSSSYFSLAQKPSDVLLWASGILFALVALSGALR